MEKRTNNNFLTCQTKKDVDPAVSPISSPELERTVVATMINSYSSIADTDGILDADCFYHAAYQEIFLAVMKLYREGDTPDLSLVASELSKSGSQIGFSDLADMCMKSTLVFDLHSHAVLLKDYSLRRKLWRLGQHLLADSCNESVPVASLQVESKEKIDGLFEDSDVELETLGRVYDNLKDVICQRMSMPDGMILGTPTGFPEIDANGGLCGGELIIIGAETSQGKTSFATAMALSSIKHGHGVAIYSMEMTAMQIAGRIASMQSGIPAKEILYSRLDHARLDHIERCMNGIDLGLMYFDEKSNSSLDSMLRSIRSMKMKYGIKGAVVDYLQLVNCKSMQMSVEQATGACTRALKNLAKDLDIWIIALSQLNRNAQNPVPSKARLRDSGQIEEAADLVFLIYRPSVSGRNYPEPFVDVNPHGTAMVIVDKGRNVGTSQFICGFKSENTLFYPLSKHELEAMRLCGSQSEDPFQSCREKAPF